MSESHRATMTVDRNVIAAVDVAAVDSDTVKFGVAGANASAGDEPELAIGATIGRYVVLETIGRGGMGVVYAAYDPRLDRKIALKLVRSRGDRATGQHRLQREAQAIAKVSHPNIVAVYDADVVDDRVFIAMEFVPGVSLRTWMEAEPRSWRAVLDVYIMAGRGLAAAHAAGLVHRDFKPDNVLLGDDGRARVLDFGLAVPASRGSKSRSRVSEPADGPGPDGDADSVSESVSSTGRLEARLTQDGVVVGTPAYMAPEARRRSTDHRSDQFSFCVALWQALYGEHPFRSRRRRNDANRWTPKDPPKNGVPAWVRAAVQRGLSELPAERWPSMDALLRQLDRRPSTRRWTIGAVAAAALVGGGGTWGLLHGPDERCRVPADRIDGVFGPARRAAVQRAFAATELSYADELFDKVSVETDRYLDAWSAMNVEACQATHVHGTQSGELLDVRMFCLDGHLRDLDALVDVWSEADAEVVRSAAQAVSLLPALEDCADVEALMSTVPPPKDPELALRVDELRQQQSHIEALERSGKIQQGLTASTHLLRDAEGIDYLPLQAELQYRLASLNFEAGRYDDAKRHAQEAYWLGDASRHDRVAIRAATSMLAITGYFEKRADLAELWSRNAQAIAYRIGERSREVARLYHYRGIIAWDGRNFEEAMALYERALALRIELLGEDHIEVADTLFNMGLIHESRGDLVRAKELFLRNAGITIANVGEQHPSTGAVFQGLGRIHAALGEQGPARDYFERALVISEDTLGAEHWLTVHVYRALGQLLHEQGEDERAEALMTKAHEVAVRSLGVANPEMAKTKVDLAEFYLETGRLDQALALAEQAVGVFEAVGGSSVRLERLVAFGMVARIHAERGRWPEALAYAERGETVCRVHEIAPLTCASLPFIIARGLEATGGDPERALEMAELARRRYVRHADGGVEILAQIEAWLAARV